MPVEIDEPLSFNLFQIKISLDNHCQFTLIVRAIYLFNYYQLKLNDLKWHIIFIFTHFFQKFNNSFVLQFKRMYQIFIDTIPDYRFITRVSIVS